MVAISNLWRNVILSSICVLIGLGLCMVIVTIMQYLGARERAKYQPMNDLYRIRGAYNECCRIRGAMPERPEDLRPHFYLELGTPGNSTHQAYDRWIEGYYRVWDDGDELLIYEKDVPSKGGTAYVAKHMGVVGTISAEEFQARTQGRTNKSQLQFGDDH